MSKKDAIPSMATLDDMAKACAEANNTIAPRLAALLAIELGNGPYRDQRTIFAVGGLVTKACLAMAGGDPQFAAALALKISQFAHFRLAEMAAESESVE